MDLVNISGLPFVLHVMLNNLGFFNVFQPVSNAVFQGIRRTDMFAEYFVIYNGQWSMFRFIWLGETRVISADDLYHYGLSYIGDAFDDKLTPAIINYSRGPTAFAQRSVPYAEPRHYELF